MMNNLVRKSVIAAGLLGFAGSAMPLNRAASIQPHPDTRLTKLRRFFVSRADPISHLAEDFILTADRNGLDWRLLPSIAVVESSGGKYQQNNNIFGWDNGATKFTSIQRSIGVIGERLGRMRYYKNKDLNGFLRTYNPVGDYPSRVKKVMRALDPQFQDSHRILLPQAI